LQDCKPIVIPVQENNPRIVITDGYQFTVPLKLTFNDLNTYCFKVSCAINDWQLSGGFIFLVITYLVGLFTGILFLKIICFMPIVYLLLFYYLNRREFIRLIPVLN
jgi:hypothetical protein